jgi:hypothetical protein
VVRRGFVCFQRLCELILEIAVSDVACYLCMRGRVDNIRR